MVIVEQDVKYSFVMDLTSLSGRQHSKRVLPVGIMLKYRINTPFYFKCHVRRDLDQLIYSTGLLCYGIFFARYAVMIPNIGCSRCFV